MADSTNNSGEDISNEIVRDMESTTKEVIKSEMKKAGKRAKSKLIPSKWKTFGIPAGTAFASIIATAILMPSDDSREANLNKIIDEKTKIIQAASATITKQNKTILSQRQLLSLYKKTGAEVNVFNSVSIRKTSDGKGFLLVAPVNYISAMAHDPAALKAKFLEYGAMTPDTNKSVTTIDARRSWNNGRVISVDHSLLKDSSFVQKLVISFATVEKDLIKTTNFQEGIAYRGNQNGTFGRDLHANNKLDYGDIPELNNN